MKNLGFPGKYLIKDRIFSLIFGFFREKRAIIEQTVRFADVSFYQGTISWDTMSTKAPGVIIRAGQNLWTDIEFERNYSEAKLVGMKRGVYWFYDSRISPQEQANILIGLLQNDLPEMEIFCDWEYNYGGGYFDLKYAVQFMKLVEAGLHNVKVGMYTGYYFFKDHTDPTLHADEYNYLKYKPLWLAWYTSNPAYVQIPAPWTEVTHWQYTSTGNGVDWGVESSGIDLNYYNGTLEEFNLAYGESVEPPIEPPGGKVDYSNGVSIIDERYYESDVTTYQIPATSIQQATFDYVPGECRVVESLNYDFACNFTPFTSCRANLGLKIDGRVYEDYHNYNPYLTLDTLPGITHVAKSWRNYLTASQGFRYIIRDGVKAATSSAWDNLEPRRLVGVDENGNLTIITVKGRQADQRGWTLHEAAEYGLSLGLYQMLDGDSGSSVQEYAEINGIKELNFGVPTNDRSPVAVFLGIDFKEPLVDDSGTPPEEDITHVIDVYTDGRIAIDGSDPF